MSRWTDEEISELVNLWPTARPHRSRIACTARARPYAERQSGCSRKAYCKVRTPNIPIREDGEGAPPTANPDHAAAATSRRQPRDAVVFNP